MVNSERNRMIRDIYRAYPYWSYQKIADLVGVSRQRVQQILKTPDNCDRLRSDMVNSSEAIKIGNKPISASEVYEKTGIPFSTIAMWIKRGHVKVVKDPGQTGPGLFVLLDPVSLQERIDRYRPRKKPATV